MRASTSTAFPQAPRVPAASRELVETGMPWRANVVNDPARDQRRAGLLVRCSAAPRLLHDDRRADLDPVIEIDHVLIGHANAAR
jgi:hypothetical protein